MSVYKTLGYEIAKVHKAIKAQLQQLLNPYEVTVQQIEVIRIIETEPGLTAAQLVERIISDSSTIMSILKRLESKSIIERIQDKNDRRNKRIYLTKKGQNLYSNLAAYIERYNRKIEKCCTGKELETFIRILSKLYEFSKTDIEIQQNNS